MFFNDTEDQVGTGVNGKPAAEPCAVGGKGPAQGKPSAGGHELDAAPESRVDRIAGVGSITMENTAVGN